MRKSYMSIRDRSVSGNRRDAIRHHSEAASWNLRRDEGHFLFFF